MFVQIYLSPYSDFLSYVLWSISKIFVIIYPTTINETNTVEFSIVPNKINILVMLCIEFCSSNIYKSR